MERSYSVVDLVSDDEIEFDEFNCDVSSYSVPFVESFEIPNVEQVPVIKTEPVSDNEDNDIIPQQLANTIEDIEIEYPDLQLNLVPVVPFVESPEIPNVELVSNNDHTYSLQSGSGKRKNSQPNSSNKRKQIENEITWTVISEERKEFEKFKKTEITTEVVLSHNLINLDLKSVKLKIDDLFGEFVTHYTHQAMDKDRVCVSISHSELNPHLHLNFIKKNFDKTKFLDTVYKLVQSNDKFLFDGRLQITVRIIKNISGGRRPRSALAPHTLEESSRRKLSVIEIKNKDNSCGYYAIALGRFLADMEAIKSNKKIYFNRLTDYATLIRQNNNKLKNLAISLCSSSGVNINQQMDLGETINKIQKYLNEYQIIVIDAQTKSNLFSGQQTSTKKRIILEYQNNHFNLIRSLTGYLNVHFFCIPCWKSYKENIRHVCPTGCEMCLSPIQCLGEKDSLCHQCNRMFYSNQCLNRHIEMNICDKIKICRICKIQYTRSNHRCDMYYCKKCGEHYQKNPHYCMMRQLDSRKLQTEDDKFKLIVAYDIEAISAPENILENDVLVHKPILIRSMVTCNKCQNQTP